MSSWIGQLPAFLLLIALLAPGLAMAYLVGARGILAWGVAPSLALTGLTVGTSAAPYLGLTWTPGLMVATQAAGLVAAAVIGILLRPAVTRHRQGRDRRRTGWFALLGAGGGTLAVLAAAALGMGTPDELVDSTDAVAHLNRLRRYLTDGNFSSLGQPGHAPYPSGFHDVAGTLAQLVPGLADGHGIVVAANLTALLAAAVVWPVGVVALARVALGRTPVGLVATGLASASFTAFPYMLMGWGVLWPNLFAAALLPGVLAPALVACRVHRPTGGVGRGLATVLTLAALPGLGLTHPNTVVALAMLLLVAVATVLVQRLATGRGTGRREGAILATVVIATVGVLVLAPRLSRQVADTMSYVWVTHDPLPVALRDGALLGLQVGTLQWGLVVLVAVGLVAVWRRPAERWVVTAWVACVLLFVVAAMGWPDWASLVTGYWYNDKVRLAALSVLPATLLVGGAVRWLAAVLASGLRAFTPAPPWRHPAPLRPTAGSAASVWSVVLLLVVTTGLNHTATTDIVERYYHPTFEERVLLTPDEDADLARIAAAIPDGAVTANAPSNGSAFLYAFYHRPVLFDSLLLNPDPDAEVIGAHLNQAATRSDVCDALRRGDIRYAVTGAVRYWLDFPERTRGIADLDGAPGFEKVASAGRYDLYRITACGFDPAWAPPQASG